ncbi:MAG: AAA family ATPase, partial [Acetobacteraceae bacterium]|nr:AAA family ATPase [Acetobacteraceae bacterium]
MACFGYPQADEHQAERAIRAALNLVETTGRIDTGQPGRLQLRIGVASGLAVVGGQPTALGEAASAAAGLAAAAEPGSVLIAASTRRLVGGLFELCPCEPAEAWQVLAETGVESRFEALRGAALAPLVGREEELELLLRRWEQAKAGSGRVVLVSGEPGIGKSRLARALQDAITGQPHVEVRLFCSPHHQDSTLHPSIAQLERAARFNRDDTEDARLAKLDAVLAQSDATDEAVALIAELLSIPTDQRERIQQMSPQVRRERTLAALLAQLSGLAARQPVLVVYEDVHWIDPSSRELLDRIIDQVARLPVLLLASFRPEFQPPWAGQPNVTSLALGRLDQHDSAALVAGVAGADALLPEVAREIAKRTDGVPLFIEEVTRAVLEAGAQAGALSSIPWAALSVPATLHASLLARLDRLGPVAKEVAQKGAAIGREFG